jgi:hypothetical protein
MAIAGPLLLDGRVGQFVLGARPCRHHAEGVVYPYTLFQLNLPQVGVVGVVPRQSRRERIGSRLSDATRGRWGVDRAGAVLARTDASSMSPAASERSLDVSVVVPVEGTNKGEACAA